LLGLHVSQLFARRFFPKTIGHIFPGESAAA
jgi:hypothetical protein